MIDQGLKFGFSYSSIIYFLTFTNVQVNTMKFFNVADLSRLSRKTLSGGINESTIRYSRCSRSSSARKE